MINFVKVILLSVMVMFVDLWKAFIIENIWNWFLTIPLKISMPYAAAVGIVFIYKIMTLTIKSTTDKPEKSFSTSTFSIMLTHVFAINVLFGYFWIFHFFVIT